MERMVGKWAFIIGILLAIIAGLFVQAIPADTAGVIVWILIILGLIIGLLNITEKEITAFLIAAIALLAVSAATGVAQLAEIRYVGPIIDAIVKNIGLIAAPAALIVSIKAIYSLGQMGKAPAMTLTSKKKK